MPIFEYVCRNCDHHFEQIVPRHDSTAGCPNCKSENVEKQLSVFAVAGSSSSQNSFDQAGCGQCGAAEPGMCQMED